MPTGGQNRAVGAREKPGHQAKLSAVLVTEGNRALVKTLGQMIPND